MRLLYHKYPSRASTSAARAASTSRRFRCAGPPQPLRAGADATLSTTPVMAHRADICGILNTIVPAMTPYYAFPLSNALNYITWRLMMIKRFVIRKTPLA